MLKKSIIILFTLVLSNAVFAGTFYLGLVNEDKGVFEKFSEKLYGKDRSDGNFSEGAYLSYVLGGGKKDENSVFQITASSDIYSPSGANKSSSVAVTGDRPFAGYLGAGAHFYRKFEDLLKISEKANMESMGHLELGLGVVGPSAQGEEIQGFFHGLRNTQKYSGWSDQIKNRFAATVRYDHSLSIRTSLIKDSLQLEVAPHASLVLGSVLGYGAVGANIRIGRDLNDFGAPRFNYLSGNDVPVYDLDGGWNWNMFFGFERRQMINNYFLEGRTKASNKKTVSMKDDLTEIHAGLRLFFKNATFDITLVKRGIEFKTQQNKQQFIRAGIGYKF